MEVSKLLGLQGFWEHQILRGVGSKGSRKYSARGERNGNPLQCSCLENPRDRDGGAWWAAVYGITQSRPRLK